MEAWEREPMFANRVDAGRRLARRLTHLAGCDPVVVGLPRGGVPVAFEVARALRAPLDVLVVRKLGVPYQPELAMGAIGEDGVTVLNPGVLKAAHIRAEELESVKRTAGRALRRLVGELRGDRHRIPLTGRTVVVVDDGIATGATVRAACRVARAQGAARVVLAVPVGSPVTVAALRDVADEVVCLSTPSPFSAVGEWYEDFSPTSDGEVIALLRRSGTDPATPDAEVVIEAGGQALPGSLTIPPDASELVVFVHGSGSSRHSPRNRFVAERLNRAGLGTLLFDLLNADEERDRRNVFDIELIGGRLVEVVRWLRRQPATTDLPIGLFGASTGAAAALWAAAEPDLDDVVAIVSRGGRPDLAGSRLNRVRVPTLLIVGGRDEEVLALNWAARAELRCVNRLSIVPGAGHLFEEDDTLRVVADLATDWFIRRGGRAKPAPPAAA